MWSWLRSKSPIETWTVPSQPVIDTRLTLSLIQPITAVGTSCSRKLSRLPAKHCHLHSAPLSLIKRTYLRSTTVARVCVCNTSIQSLTNCLLDRADWRSRRWISLNSTRVHRQPTSNLDVVSKPIERVVADTKRPFAAHSRMRCYETVTYCAFTIRRPPFIAKHLLGWSEHYIMNKVFVPCMGREE